MATLPSHVWTLRDDCESIKRLVEGTSQTGQSETKEKPAIKSEVKDSQTVLDTEQTNLIRQHDVAIFEKSDAILMEEDVEIILGIELEAASGFYCGYYRRVGLFYLF